MIKITDDAPKPKPTLTGKVYWHEIKHLKGECFKDTGIIRVITGDNSTMRINAEDNAVIVHWNDTDNFYITEWGDLDCRWIPKDGPEGAADE